MRNNVYIQLSVSALRIILQDNRSIPSRNQNYIFTQFTFVPTWDGLNKIAIFSRSELDAVHVPIIDNMAQIPNEFMDEPGEIIVSVFAGDRRTVNSAIITVSQSGFLLGVPSQPPITSYEYVQTPGSSITLIKESDDQEFQYFSRGEWQTISPGELAGTVNELVTALSIAQSNISALQAEVTAIWVTLNDVDNRSRNNATDITSIQAILERNGIV